MSLWRSITSLMVCGLLINASARSKSYSQHSSLAAAAKSTDAKQKSTEPASRRSIGDAERHYQRTEALLTRPRQPTPRRHSTSHLEVVCVSDALVAGFRSLPLVANQASTHSRKVGQQTAVVRPAQCDWNLLALASGNACGYRNSTRFRRSNDG